MKSHGLLWTNAGIAIILVIGIAEICYIFYDAMFRETIKLNGGVYLRVRGIVDSHETNSRGVKTTEIQTKDGIHISISDLPGGLHRVLMWKGVEFNQDRN